MFSRHDILYAYLVRLQEHMEWRSRRVYKSARKKPRHGRRKTIPEAQALQRKKFDNGWFPVSSLVLKTVFGTSYAKDLQILQDEGRIIRSPGYSTGSHSCSRFLLPKKSTYRIPGGERKEPEGPGEREKGNQEGRGSGGFWFPSLLQIRKNPYLCRPKGIPRKLWNRIHKAFRCKLIKGKNLERLGLSTKETRCAGGRRHNQLTSMTKMERQKLHWDTGDPVVEVDAKSCYWRIVARKCPRGARLWTFMNHIPDFYVSLTPDQPRKESKRHSFQYIFGGTPNPWGRGFMKRFPEVHLWMKGLRDKLGSSRMCTMFTQVESRIMEKLVDWMDQRGFLAIRLHDAILTTPEHQELVQTMMNEEFEKLIPDPQIP